MVIKQLVYLVALARERHFGRAATACGVSQPTLSAALRQLEDELGVPIVERGHRYNGLTAEGEEVLAHAIRILSECDSLRQSLAAQKGDLTGRLRLGAIPTALPIVPRVTFPFTAQHPSVTLAILSHTSVELQRGIDNFEIDAGITYIDNEPFDRVIAKPIYIEEYVLLTDEVGPFEGRETVGWEEAAALRLCLLTPDMQNRRIVDSVFRKIGRTPTVSVETNSIFNLMSHTGAGAWSSIVPKQLVTHFGQPPGTRTLALVDPVVTHQIGIVVADRDPLPPIVRAIFDSAVSP